MRMVKNALNVPFVKQRKLNDRIRIIEVNKNPIHLLKNYYELYSGLIFLTEISMAKNEIGMMNLDHVQDLFFYTSSRKIRSKFTFASQIFYPTLNPSHRYRITANIILQIDFDNTRN